MLWTIGNGAGGSSTLAYNLNGIKTNSWYMITLMYNSSNLSIYINGTLVNSSTGSYTVTNAASSGIGVGRAWDTETSSAAGSYDEIGYWQRRLTSAEITTLYNNGTALAYPFTTPASNFTIQAVDALNGSTINTFNATILSFSGNQTLNHNNWTGVTNLTGGITFDDNITFANATNATIQLSNVAGNYFSINYNFNAVNVQVFVDDNLVGAQSDLCVGIPGAPRCGSSISSTLNPLVGSTIKVVCTYVTAGTQCRDFSINNIFINSTSTENSYNTTTGLITTGISNAVAGLLNITVRAANYTNASQTNYNATINLVQPLTKLNTVTFNYFNASNLQRITGQNVTLYLTGISTNYSSISTIGNSTFSEIDSGTYAITITSDNYETYLGTINTGNGSYQTFDAYLSPITANPVTFSIQSLQGGNIIENATMQIETQLNPNTSYVVINSLISDITGAIQFNYIEGQNYRFTVSATNYTTKTFTLTPILFDSYTVLLSKDLTLTTTDDYETLQVQLLPQQVINNMVTNFSYRIIAPEGNLQQYNLTITTSFDATNIFNFGVSAYGGFVNTTAFINTTANNPYVYMNYSYLLSNGLTKQFFIKIPVFQTAGDATAAANKDNPANLPLFDRIFIIVIVTIISTGVAFWYAGEAGAAVIATCVMGYFIATGFIPIWATLVSIIILVLLLARGGY